MHVFLWETVSYLLGTWLGMELLDHKAIEVFQNVLQINYTVLYLYQHMSEVLSFLC